MVLGSLDNTITYPKSIYYSAQPYGFGYYENSLMIEPPSWDDENNRWLAFLYGLEYERIIPPKNVDKDKAWLDYIQRIETALSAGCAVQTSRSWMGVRETDGKIMSKTAGSLFWWEGLSKKHRPDMHYFTITGLDHTNKEVIFHDPVLGWYGYGKDCSMPLHIFRHAIQHTPIQHRYITITFTPSDNPQKSESEIIRLLNKRISKKIQGDPSVYNSVEMWQSFFGRDKITRNFKHGIPGLKALQKDLQPDRFKKILTLKLQRHSMQPSDVVSWIDLMVYHKAWVALIGAEYLEKTGQINEWKKLFHLHLLYEEMSISSAELRSIFKLTSDVDKAMPRVKPILKDMQHTIDEIIDHLNDVASR